jgi:hypothetical protein
MNRDVVLKRVQELRDEINLLVRHNAAYDVYHSHTVEDKELNVERMGRLRQIKRELADIKAGKMQ